MRTHYRCLGFKQQIFHCSAASVSTRWSTPLLITDDGKKLHDSVAIIRYANKRYASSAQDLYPTPEVAKLQEHYMDRLGPLARRIAYNYVLQDVDSFLDMCEKNCGPRQARVMRWLWPWARPYLVNGLQVTPEKAAKARTFLLKEFDAVAARAFLCCRYHLCSTELSRADGAAVGGIRRILAAR